MITEKINLTPHTSHLTPHIYEITFKLGTYNFEFPLVIDPWVSYYGGSQPDRGCSVATDNLGNVVFTGQTQSINFPVTAGVLQTVFNGNIDAFVVKMNVNGGRVWATYYGGTNREYGWGIATDAGGNVIVSGETWYSNLPIASAHQGSIWHSYRCILAKVKFIRSNAMGNLLWRYRI